MVGTWYGEFHFSYEAPDHIAATCKELIQVLEATKYQDEEMKMRKKYLVQILQEFMSNNINLNPPKPKNGSKLPNWSLQMKLMIG